MYGLIGGGDPFGVIAAPIGWGIQEYIKQRQRLIANGDPEAERGRKFGYVREGDKWYPAIQTSKERDEGWIGSNKTQVTFQYGTEIKWRKAKGSTEWIPYFEPGQYQMKNFHLCPAQLREVPDNFRPFRKVVIHLSVNSANPQLWLSPIREIITQQTSAFSV